MGLTGCSRWSLLLSFQSGSRTSNCAATRRLIPSCGVNYGLRQPLSLFTALGCITLAKTALRRVIPPFGAFFWP